MTYSIRLVFLPFSFSLSLSRVCVKNHDNQAIYNRAVRVLETYFGAEEEAETGIAPAVAEGGQQYGFGGGPAPMGGFNNF